MPFATMQGARGVRVQVQAQPQTIPLPSKQGKYKGAAWFPPCFLIIYSEQNLWCACPARPLPTPCTNWIQALIYLSEVQQQALGTYHQSWEQEIFQEDKLEEGSFAMPANHLP